VFSNNVAEGRWQKKLDSKKKFLEKDLQKLDNPKQKGFNVNITCFVFQMIKIIALSEYKKLFFPKILFTTINKHSFSWKFMIDI